MSTKNKILLTIIMLLWIITLFTENQNIHTLLVMGMFVLVVIMKLTDYIDRKKLIKQINSKNMTYIKFKENSNIIIMINTQLNILKDIKTNHLKDMKTS